MLSEARHGAHAAPKRFRHPVNGSLAGSRRTERPRNFKPRPPAGRHNKSPGWSCVSSGTLGKTKNISEPRSVAEWVAEAMASYFSWLSATRSLGASRLRLRLRLLHPHRSFGVLVILCTTPRVPLLTQLHPGQLYYRPAGRRGAEFRSPTAHQLLDKFQFSGQMPDMLPAACDSLENAACVHE